METPKTHLYRFTLAHNPNNFYLKLRYTENSVLLQSHHTIIIMYVTVVPSFHLRPHLEEFLTGVKDLFELHIYTMGSRAYARKVAMMRVYDGFESPLTTLSPRWHKLSTPSRNSSVRTSSLVMNVEVLTRNSPSEAPPSR